MGRENDRQRRHRGVAREWVGRLKALFHRACRLAARLSGGVLANPVSDTELSSWSLTERPKDARSPLLAEARALMKAAERGGDESAVAARGGVVVKSPKTRASIRTVAVDASTLARLGSLRKRQEELALACGVPFDRDGFVFSVEPGGILPPHPDALTQAMSKLRAAAGLSLDVHLHSLRHVQATTLDPVISEAQEQARLTWLSTEQMARHDTDGVPDEDRRAVDHAGRLLG